jgi:TamB, inner membrane protein subunit of TAM complex
MRIKAIFNSFLIFFLGFIYYLIATQSGLIFISQAAQRLLPGKLVVTGLKGSIFGPLSIEHLFYQTKHFTFSVSELTVNWKVRGLLQGHILINPLQIKQLTFYDHRADNANIELKSNVQKIKQFSWLKRVRLAEMQLQLCEIQIGNTCFEIKGHLNHQWQLDWRMSTQLQTLSSQSERFVFSGQLTGNWLDKPQLLLSGETSSFAWNPSFSNIKNSLNNYTIPTTQWQGYLNESGFKLTVSTQQGPNQILARLALPYYRGNGFPDIKELIQVAAHVTLGDWKLLAAVLPPTVASNWTKVTGKLQVDFELEGLLTHLQSYFQQSPGYFSKPIQYFLPFSPTGRFSLIWQSPFLPFAGLRFNVLNIHADLAQARIQWRGQVVAAEDNKLPFNLPVGEQWRLTGETRLAPQPSAISLTNTKRSFQTLTHLHLSGDALPLFINTPYALLVAPALTFTMDAEQVDLKGALRLPAVQLDLSNVENEAISLDREILFVEDNSTKQAVKVVNHLPFDLNVKLLLGKEVYLRYQGLKSRLEGELLLINSAQHPFAVEGELQLVTGYYRRYGQQLNIEPGSRLLFSERLLNKSLEDINPHIDIKASREVAVQASQAASLYNHTVMQPLITLPVKYNPANQLAKGKVGLHLQGPLLNPQIHLFVEPAGLIVNPTDQLAYLLTGQSSYRLNSASLQLLVNAASDLNGEEKNTHIFTELKKKVHLDHLDIQPDSDVMLDATNPNMQDLTKSMVLVLGKKLVPRLSLAFYIGLMNNPNRTLKINYLLNRYFSCEGSIGNLNNGVELLYQAEAG